MGSDWSIQRRRGVGKVEVESDISHSGDVSERQAKEEEKAYVDIFVQV